MKLTHEEADDIWKAYNRLVTANLSAPDKQDTGTINPEKGRLASNRVPS